MSIRRLFAAAGGLVMAFAAGVTSPLLAQGNDINADSKFIKDAAADNFFEIRLGTIAQSKGANSSVKQFGQQMVNDHTTMLNAWKDLVTKTGYPFQPGLNNDQQQQVKSLNGMSGAQFDQAYMTAMVQGHQKTLQNFQSESQSAKSAEVKNLIATQLPTIQQHLNLAEQTGAQVGVSTNVIASAKNGQPATPTTSAQTTTPTVTSSAQTTGNLTADSKFIKEAAQDNLLEVRLGTLAQQKASDANVKQYAQHEVSDHTVMDNQWVSLAGNNGMTLQTTMGPRHKKKLNALQKLSGKDFDKAYMTMSIQSHQDYVDYFSKEGKATQSSQVRDLAANDLRSFQLHLDQAKQIGGQVGVNVAAALKARTTKAYKTQY
jgi:putative membrane protein